MGLTNAMEGLNLTRKDISNIVQYYKVSNKKIQLDINKLLSKCSEFPYTANLTSKEFDRLKLYSFRYKMIMQHISDNTDSRLNKIYRKSLTTPNKDFD